MVDLVELVQSGGNLKTLQRLWLQLFRFYFRVEVEGIEHIPKKGAAVIVPNHSGFAGFDAVLLTFIVKRETRRRARILAHRAFFDFSKTLKEAAEYFGLRKAGLSTGVDTLKSGRLLIIFPEGETGNFKSSLRAYQLQRFHTGYLWMATQAKAPIVPCIILGAEETHLNLGNINLNKYLKKIRIPLPVNLLPLPAKWKIRFLPPIPPETYDPAWLERPREMKLQGARLQRMMQQEIRNELKKRPFVYFEQAHRLKKTLDIQLKKLRRRFPV